MNLTPEQLDTHLDAILRASGSALKHYSLHKSREDMRNALQAAITASLAPEQWRPMETAPTDGTTVRLLVDYSGEDAGNPLEDATTCQTIGVNTDSNTGDSEGWRFAGWSWEQDCFTQGYGKPVGWLPMALVAPSGNCGFCGGCGRTEDVSSGEHRSMTCPECVARGEVAP